MDMIEFLLLQSQTRTPLEQQMDEILNNSPVVQEERKVCLSECLI
jgi:hypothetical protein